MSNCTLLKITEQLNSAFIRGVSLQLHPHYLQLYPAYITITSSPCKLRETCELVLTFRPETCLTRSISPTFSLHVVAKLN